MPCLYRTLLAVTALCAVSAPAAANLLVNPGFEDLNGAGFTGWTITGNGILQDAVFPNNGTYDANFTDLIGTSPLSVLSQDVATSPGTQYTLGFSLLDESGLSTDTFEVAFGGFTATITGDQAAPPGTEPSFYTDFSFTIPGSDVSSILTTLAFSSSIDPSSEAGFNLDDVSLAQSSGGTVPMPEPASSVLVAGLLALARARRRGKFGSPAR
jgi:hypothetical protein